MRYRLLSTPHICAPGIVAWAKNGYAFPRDRKALLRVICDGWNVPRPAAVALLSGAVPHETGPDETVTFTWPPDNRPTQAAARAKLREHGITFRAMGDGEFRVNYRGGTESTAAYETDIQAAIDTGLAMARERDSMWRPRNAFHRAAALFTLDSYRGRTV